MPRAVLAFIVVVINHGWEAIWPVLASLQPLTYDLTGPQRASIYLHMQRMVKRPMKFLDIGVLILYATAILAIGHYYKRRVQSRDDFLLGGRTMNPVMVGVSLFATLTSTLSYLAYPGEMIKYGPMIFSQMTAIPLVMGVVGWVLIPRIMAEREATTGYELLEFRLGLPGRLLGAAMFMAMRTVWMASILYATTNKVLVPLLELDPRWSPLISAGMGVITLIYTSAGGMRAVVVTDALQSAIMMIGTLVVLAIVTNSLGGATQWWPRHWVPHWQTPVFWFSSAERVTFMGAFLNYVVWLICTSGSDQMAIQRYLSTRDARAARRSFAVSLVADSMLSLLLGLVGLAILAFYVAHPDRLDVQRALVTQADELLPKFIVTELPTGLSGLVIAALLSAAMSSLSSGMNSSSAVITNDFLPRLTSSALSPQDSVRIARLASTAIGSIAVGISMFIGSLVSNLLELCMTVVNLLTAPLFVLFFLAMFVPWATPAGGIAATISSVVIALGIAHGHWGGLQFLWASPISLLVGIVVGSAVSLISPTRTSARS